MDIAAYIYVDSVLDVWTGWDYFWFVSVATIFMVIVMVVVERDSAEPEMGYYLIGAGRGAYRRKRGPVRKKTQTNRRGTADDISLVKGGIDRVDRKGL